MTYNILYGGVGRESLIRDVITTIRPDVAVFTEVTSAGSFEKIADAVGPHVAGRDNRTAREYPVIVSRWPIRQSELHGPPWAPRKWVEATLRLFDGPPLTVHGVHLVPQPLWPFELCRRWEVACLLKRSLAELFGWKAVASLGGEASDHLPVWADFEWRVPGS